MVSLLKLATITEVRDMCVVMVTIVDVIRME